MKEYNIQTEPLTFIAIRDLEIHRKINEHGTARIEGYIADEDEEDYIKQLLGSMWERINAVGRDGENQTLFWGLVTGFSIQRENDQKRMILELTTGTYLMDLIPHFRTFQNEAVTFEEIFQTLTEPYENSGLIKNRPLTEPTGELVIQYRETDWEFLKRMAGRHHSFLVPSTTIYGVKYFYDLPKGVKQEIPDGSMYAFCKDVGGYLKKKSRGLTGLREAASIEYTIKTRDNYNLGDWVAFNGQQLFIYQIESVYQEGEMLHICHCKARAGMDTLETCQEDIAGCSFPAKVLQVREDKVQIKVFDDENADQDISLWYPYSTVYSSPDGTGWYCMPEIGDVVRLKIPSRREAGAYVVSSIHLDTDSPDRKNPEHKVIKSKYQKEIRFTPDSIIITNNQGTKIALTDGEGVQIISQKSIVIQAKDNLTLSSETGSLTAAGTTSVNLKQNTTSLDIDKGISFTGGNLRVQ